MHISVVIPRSPQDVYEFVTRPENLSQWVAGVDISVTPVKFTARNEFGVMDHTVTLPDGSFVFVPLRVLPAEHGSEVVFTLRRVAGATDREFEADRAAVEADLATLASILQT